MEIDISENDFAALIAEAFRLELKMQDDSYLFDFNQVGVEKVLMLSKEELGSTIDSLRNFDNPEETVISNSNNYEALVREESPFPKMRHRLRDDALAVEDQDNSLKYRLSTPSDEYLLLLLFKVSKIASTKAMVMPVPMTRVFDRPRDEELTSIFDVLRIIIPRFLTLRIESDKNRSITDLSKFSSAFLFQLSYNMDVALVPQRHIEEVVRAGRINRIRRVSMNELDPPRRHYIPDLIYHYQLAVGSDNPFLEFISYYHVAEHFFEMIFNEDLVLRIKNKMTQPDFSYKRKNDISALIKDISKSLQIRHETITFSEQEALRLTIDNYVDLEDLKQKLDDYDANLREYYRTTKVDFSNGGEVDFNNTDKSLVCKNLAARIYKTRNSIVHSKESEKSKYMPFRDDKMLVKEVPLLRFIAEQIIIEPSNIVG